MRKKKRSEKILDAMFYPAIIILLAITVIPIIWTVVTSLKAKSSIFSRIPLWWGFTVHNNYYGPFMQEGYLQLILNSILTSIGCIILSIPLAFTAAYAFSRFKIFGASTLYFWMLICRMVPIVAFIIPYYLIITQLGLYDNTLGLILVYSLFNIPFAVWLMKSGIDGIPQALDEAALLDGASITSTLSGIIFPLALPTIAAATILIFILSWNEYILAYVLTGTQAQTLTAGLRAFVSCPQIQLGKMAAVTMTSLIPPIILVTILQRYIISGLTMGAVKAG